MNAIQNQKLIHATKFQKIENTNFIHGNLSKEKITINRKLSESQKDKEQSKTVTKSHKNTRICVIIEGINKKLRLPQGNLISKSSNTVSLSQAINHALRKSLEKNLE